MSNIKSVPVEESDADQRREYARAFLNLDLPQTASDEEISSAIERANPGTKMIFVQEAPTPEQANEPSVVHQFTPEEQAKIDKMSLRPEEQGRPTAGSLGRGDPRFLIEIPSVETDDNTGNMDVEVGVNGRAWQLKRGMPLSVPARVVEALQHAISDVVRHEADRNNSFEVNTTVRSAKRVPFQILERPTEQAMEAWHKETDALFCA